MPKQLAFSFGFAPSYAPDDLLVTDANRAAVTWLEAWPEGWPSYGLVLSGVKGLGKTHLAHLWAARSGARWLDPSLLTGDLHQLLQRHRRWVMDGLENWLEPAWQPLLFHFFNLLASVEGHVLITANQPPAQMNIRLPDLASRLRMLPVVALEAPDEATLAQLLLKWLHDRQWHMSHDAMMALLTLAERTPAGVLASLEKLEATLGSPSHRGLTPPLIRAALGATSLLDEAVA